MPAERIFHAMGSNAHVIVVGGPDGLVEDAQCRIADLERRWSRFAPDSEVSRLTQSAGDPVRVSGETRELVERALLAWKLTGGLFDPTVLGAVIRAGYDRTFDELDRDTQSGSSALGFGAASIEIAGDTVRLPPGCGFDPGGVGKGLAADIVVDELRAAGAHGMCVNLGGDVRVEGAGPTGGAWTVAIEHPLQDRAIGRLGLARGATATSTTLKRRWQVGGEARHHLIDPATGTPSTSDLTFVTTVSGFAWAAEVFAKAVLLHGTPRQFELLVDSGVEALTVDAAGNIATTAGMHTYLGEVPASLLELDRELAETRRS